MLDESNSDVYFARDDRHDMVLAINGARRGARTCRVMEKWVAHFHKIKVTIIPVPEIATETGCGISGSMPKQRACSTICTGDRSAARRCGGCLRFQLELLAASRTHAPNG